jgi:hypothetical protein
VITTSALLSELYTKKFGRGRWKKLGKGKSSTRNKKRKRKK